MAQTWQETKIIIRKRLAAKDKLANIETAKEKLTEEYLTAMAQLCEEEKIQKKIIVDATKALEAQ